MLIKKLFLLVAAATVAIIALLYGISPQWFAQTFLEMDSLDLNIAHILRAIMCLYLGLAAFWVYAAYHAPYRNTAVLTTMIFAGSLVTGRLISVIADGQPATLLIVYITMEFVFTPLAYWVFKLPE